MVQSCWRGQALQHTSRGGPGALGWYWRQRGEVGVPTQRPPGSWSCNLRRRQNINRQLFPGSTNTPYVSGVHSGHHRRGFKTVRRIFNPIDGPRVMPLLPLSCEASRYRASTRRAWRRRDVAQRYSRTAAALSFIAHAASIVGSLDDVDIAGTTIVRASAPLLPRERSREAQVV